MTDDLCYTSPTQEKSVPVKGKSHDERIEALVRFIARCAAEADYNALHDIIQNDLENERKQ